MKRTFLKFLPIAAAVLLATSCSKDTDGDSSVAPDPTGRDDVHIVSTTTESKTVPFSIKVTGGGTLSKVAYADDGSKVTVKFDAITDADREMTVLGGGKSTTLKLSSVDGDGVATFDGEWTDGEPGKGTDITATITIAATGGDKSSFTEGTEKLEDLMKKCGHTYTGSFKYKTDNSVTLKDDKAYIEIIMSSLQHDIDLTIDGEAKNYPMNNGKVWIVVDDKTTFTTNFTTKKECVAGRITTINRKGFVDLGIKQDGKFTGILWADHNIGALNDAPEEYGNYYAWGEITTKSEYTWSNYKYGRDKQGEETHVMVNKYCPTSQADYWYYVGVTATSPDDKTILEPSDDIAYQTNNKWSMPTNEEFEALESSCYWVLTSNYNGKDGLIVYKNKGAESGTFVNKNATPNSSYSTAYDTHIFLPSAGRYNEDGLKEDGSCGSYWSSSLLTWSSSLPPEYSVFFDPLSANKLYYYPQERFASISCNRYYGLPVRAVRRMNQFEESYDGNFESEKETKL